MTSPQSIQHAEQLLGSRFNSQQMLRNVPMSSLTTFEVGGPADFVLLAGDASEIVAAIGIAETCDIPWRVMGRGSNILASDQGVEGIVICIERRMARVDVDGTTIYAQAGATNEQVAQAALEAGLTGYEFASGIPGSIGGAAIMNAGAYDGEFKDVCVQVACLTPDGDIVCLDAQQAEWSYRHSMMADAGYIVLDAQLQLQPGDPSQIRARMDDLAQRRRSKQPLELPSAGSTFKRPQGHYAGQLIEQAGMRGHRVGGAMVSEKHCGFVVNAGSATCADVLQVIADVQEAVLRNSGVQLEPEVRIWA